jgi:sugar O-acyltransferase (sialic acid O-acetyltransferase NeuD family)
MKDLVVVGSGSTGRLAQQIVQDLNQEGAAWRVLGFLDENSESHGTEVAGLCVLGGLEWLDRYPETHLVIAIANPVARFRIAAELERKARSFATLIHPRAWIASRTKVHSGSIIYPGVLIDPDVTVGRHVILNKACTIGHDAVIGDFVTLAPGVNVGGAVRVGVGCDLGINCATLQNLSIGGWSVVGGGAVVTRDLPENVTAVGVPAKIIKERTSAPQS